MPKVFPLHMMFMLVFFCLACRSQPSSPFAPEPGVYTGSTLNVSGTMHYSYNPITGFGAQPGTTVTPGVNLAGDLVMSTNGSNKGTYSLSKLQGWKGDWQYDPASGQLNFTGPAKPAIRHYHAGKGTYSITLVIPGTPGSKEGITYYFTKKATRPFPRPSNPNGDLKGLFTVKPDLNTIAFLDVSSGKITNSFAGRAAATNSQHHTIAIGFTDNTSYYQISLADASGNLRQLTPSEIMSFNWPFSHYQFGILSEDNTKMALMGKTPDSYRDLVYTPGEYAIGVFTVTGQLLGLLPIEDNKYIIPSFLPDGRIIYSPRTGGISLSDASYKNTRTIYAKPINALAVSPDGKQLVFSEGVHFYTMNLDGSNKKQVVCNGEPLEADAADNVITIAYAPGGKSFAVSYKLASGNGILIVPLDGSNYRFVKDEEGEVYKHEGQVLTWH